eukprot:scaffold6880_cov110-Isochrysis_galbana.AAC.2
MHASPCVATHSHPIPASFTHRARAQLSSVKFPLPSPSQYIEFVADRLLGELGCEPHYGSCNPFDWMDLISMQVCSHNSRYTYRGGGWQAGQRDCTRRRISALHFQRVLPRTPKETAGSGCGWGMGADSQLAQRLKQ